MTSQVACATWISVVLAIVSTGCEPASEGEPAASPFVGEATCARCHRGESEAWRGSQHARAMQPATAETVLGDFGGASFTYHGVTSTFSRRDGRFVVRTDGPEGRLADFDVPYTFGVYPLQQYLLPLAGGRMQALSIAWDARPREAGGQRWLHLYPEEHVDHRDELHWTGLQQNWNYVCADCHSTNLRRNYDVAQDRYATTWAELSVSCEACHGPGARHVAWAEKRPGVEHLADRGLAIALDERRDVTWIPDGRGNAARSSALASHREVDTCGVCHARRTPLGVDPGPTGRLLDTHMPALLVEGLYHADGQQRDEVYTYGSFLQSRMYAKGVTCGDCHDPHTEGLRAPGNALCARCHAPATYDVPAHHIHPAGGAAAQCVTCHMPARTYMQVDPRRDHSMRVPRPDLSMQYGVPNACASCHADRGDAWAARAIEAAHGPERAGFQTFTDALATGRTGAPGALQGLAALARDTTAPPIARATALSDLRRFPGPTMLGTVRAVLGDPEPLVRAAAMDALERIPPAVRAPIADLRADDAVKAVRVRAGRMLAGAPTDGVAPDRLAARERARAEYVASEAAMADRPEAHANLGTFYAEEGDAERAEAEYRAASRLQPDFVPAYANLADLYRTLGRDGDAAALLAEGLRAVPGDPSLSYALGLTRVREKRLPDALPLLAHAATARPDDPRFAYVYAVALQSDGRVDDALGVLAKAVERWPYDPDLLLALATFNRDAGRRIVARDYARRLAAVAPEAPGPRRLVESLAAE